MKKLLTFCFFLAVLLTTSLKSFSQAFKEGDNLLNATIGVGNSFGGLGLGASFEHGFSDYISAGGSVDYLGLGSLYGTGSLLYLAARGSYHAGELLKVNDNHTYINAAAEEKDAASPLNYFRKMTALRKSSPVLIYGKYTLLDKDNPHVYAYTRELDGKKLLVMLNFSAKNATANTGIDLSKGKILINNYATAFGGKELRPYEAVVYEYN